MTTSFEWDTSFLDFSRHDFAKNKIKQINANGSRFYQIEGDTEERKLFSITTVLGDDPQKKKALQEWRNRVGKEEAAKISSFASRRGTTIHSLLEQHIRGEEIDWDSVMPHNVDSFERAVPSLKENLTKIYDLEKRMFSLNLGVAGTVDGLVQWNGVDSVLDFKTSRKVKKKEYITDYFLQTTAYSLMLEEMTGKVLDRLVIFIVNDEEDHPQIFIEERSNWVPLLLQKIHQFHSRRGLTPPPVFCS